jgi:hypothetical protein
MKKQLLTLFGALATATAFSQSIPNGGFENWTASTYEEPLNFFTSNSNNRQKNFPVSNVIKTTNSYHASFAVQLNTILYNSIDTLSAFVANGNPGSPAGQGIPYNQKPTGLKGYYKSNIVLGDTALIIVEYKLAGSVIGLFTYKFKSSQSTYTSFFLPTPLGATPDSMIFAATSSNLLANNFKGIPGNMLQLDSLTFTGGVTQPVLFDGDFENWVPKSSYSLNGWDVSGNGIIRTTDANSGTYALELQTTNSGGGVFAAEATTGRSVPTGTLPRYPYSNTIDTLSFYYKYVAADPADSADITLNFLKNGVMFQGIRTLLPAIGTYTYIKVPFNLSQVPDSVIVFINSSKNCCNLPSTYMGADFKVDDITFKSQQIPVTNFSIPSITCINMPIQLNDNSSNIPTTFTWSASGGGVILSGGNTANPTVTYTTAGSFTISLTTANSHGAGSIVTKTITVNSVPTLTVSSGFICSGGTAVLTATGASTYTWTSGPTAGTYTVSPTTTSNYTVTGTSVSGCVNTQTTSVTVVANPTIAVNLSSICLGQQTGTLTASGANTYTWFPATGLSASTGSTVSATPSVTTHYTVSGTVGTCSSVASTTVTVNPLPTVTVTSATICAGGSTTLAVGGATTYSWSPATGLSASTGAIVTANPIIICHYTVTGTDANNCVSSATSTVTVNPTPTVCIGNNNPVCAGQTINLNYCGTAVSTYTWTGPGAFSSNSASPNIPNATGAASGSYSLSVTDVNGCMSSSTTNVAVDVITPSITVTNESCSGCADGSATLSATGGSGVYMYTWSPTGGTMPVGSGLTAGNYTVCVTDGNGCSICDVATVGTSMLISSVYKNDLFSVYPNPSNGVFTISVADANATASVFDLTGKKVALFNLSTTKSQIDLSSYTDGIYFIEVATQQGIFRKKITKTD